MVNQFQLHSIKIKSAEAINRDEQGNYSEALKQYGICLQSLGLILKEDNLLQDIQTNQQSFKQISQAVKISKMCFERISHIIDNQIVPKNQSNPSNTTNINTTTTNNMNLSSTMNTPINNHLSSSFTMNTPNIQMNIPTTMMNQLPPSHNSSTCLNSSFLSSYPISTTPKQYDSSINVRNSIHSFPTTTNVIPPQTLSTNNSYRNSPTNNIEFQAPPGANVSTSIVSTNQLDPNTLNKRLSMVSSLNKEERRKSLREVLFGSNTHNNNANNNNETKDQIDQQENEEEGDNEWSKVVRNKFINNYKNNQTFRTRDELFDKDIIYTESAEEQWAKIREYILSITDQVAQHPINNLLIYFVQKFEEEFKIQEDTMWLNVHEANKQIENLSIAIVKELSNNYWNCILISAELKHYITKALIEGIVRRVYKTLIEVYETQTQNKEIENKLELIGKITLDELGVEDKLICQQSELFNNSIQLSNTTHLGKSPYKAIDILVQTYYSIVDSVNQISNFNEISDNSVYGIILFVIQNSKTYNLPSTINFIRDYLQEEEMSQDERDVLQLLDNVLNWAFQFDV
ncbi:hypothetical protein ABK040_007896 [Willaertia magna]